jgi:hypothetical protein
MPDAGVPMLFVIGLGTFEPPPCGRIIAIPQVDVYAECRRGVRSADEVSNRDR